MADQVDLDEPGHRVIPSVLRPGADRDLDFSNDPGLGWLRPLSWWFLRSRARGRSMVAADIDTSNPAVWASMSSSPNRRHTATSSGSAGASRLPAGIPALPTPEDQGSNDFPTVDRWARGVRARPQSTPQGLPGMDAVPSRRGTQLIELWCRPHDLVT